MAEYAMLRAIGKVLIGSAIIAGSFWATLAFLGPVPSQQPPDVTGTIDAPASGPVSFDKWNEKLYLAVNPDVAAAVARGEFHSGREHYDLAGFTEHREGGFVPRNWNEAEYLRRNPDVATAVTTGMFISGYHHWLAAGRHEGRHGGFPDQITNR